MPYIQQLVKTSINAVIFPGGFALHIVPTERNMIIFFIYLHTVPTERNAKMRIELFLPVYRSYGTECESIFMPTGHSIERKC
ncbi:hypothetical protein EGI32_19005 [Ferruginibacter sp. HRS2-29]|nr:hypothetical protein [Ferruginibacter sp. HRS2-29]